MKSNIFALVFGEFETFRCVNPSVKTVSQEPVLPAPLTQGSLRRSRARGFIDTLKAPHPGSLCAFLNPQSSAMAAIFISFTTSAHQLSRSTLSPATSGT